MDPLTASETGPHTGQAKSQETGHTATQLHLAETSTLEQERHSVNIIGSVIGEGLDIQLATQTSCDLFR